MSEESVQEAPVYAGSPNAVNSTAITGSPLRNGEMEKGHGKTEVNVVKSAFAAVNLGWPQTKGVSVQVSSRFFGGKKGALLNAILKLITWTHPLVGDLLRFFIFYFSFNFQFK